MQVLCIISLIPTNPTLGIPPMHSELLVEEIQFFTHSRSGITLFYVKKQKKIEHHKGI